MKEKIEYAILNKFMDYVASEKKDDINIFSSIEETGMDSLSLISLIVQIEEEYDIEFNDEDLEQVMLSSIDCLIEKTVLLVESIKSEV